MSLRQYANLSDAGNRLLRLRRKFLNLLWPPRSIVTGKQLAGPGLIEPHLWNQLRFLNGPKCAQCGFPFEVEFDVQDALDGTVCGACRAQTPVFDLVRAPLVYNDTSSQIILRFKHGAERSGLALMAGWMVEALGTYTDHIDLILPVPLHASRLRQRGFNQSFLLAKGIEKLIYKPVGAHILKRHKNTQSQAGKSAEGRKRNVSGAFKIPKRHAKRLKGKTVLLVDDVFTTGSTVEACSRELKRFGVGRVYVIAFARVVSAQDPTI